MGVHGPYESLDEYREFLAGLHIRNFEVAYVTWNPLGENKPGNQEQTTSPQEHKARGRAKFVLGKFDQDGSGGISKDEAPGKMKENFSRLDKDGNGSLSEIELRSLPPR